MELINSLSDLIPEIMLEFIITVLSLQNVLSEPVPGLGRKQAGSVPVRAPQYCKLKAAFQHHKKTLQIYKQKEEDNKIKTDFVMGPENFMPELNPIIIHGQSVA